MKEDPLASIVNVTKVTDYNRETSIIPLTIVSPGKKVRIVFLDAGRGLRAHLIGIGLNEGSEIEVIQQGRPGPFLIAIKEARLALGPGMAQKIMVSDPAPLDI